MAKNNNCILFTTKLINQNRLVAIFEFSKLFIKLLNKIINLMSLSIQIEGDGSDSHKKLEYKKFRDLTYQERIHVMDNIPEAYNLLPASQRQKLVDLFKFTTLPAGFEIFKEGI